MIDPCKGIEKRMVVSFNAIADNVCNLAVACSRGLVDKSQPQWQEMVAQKNTEQQQPESKKPKCSPMAKL